MGQLSFPPGTRIYVDANVWIYHLEGHPRYFGPIERLKDLTAFQEVQLLTSELSICEVLVPAQRRQEALKIATYLAFFENGSFAELIPTTRAVYVEASRLRAALNLKTPDAIHLASAALTGCTAFLTNDMAIRMTPGMQRVLLSEL